MTPIRPLNSNAFVGPTYGDCGACRDPVGKDDSVAVVDDLRMFRGGTFRAPAWFTRPTARSRWKRTAVMGGLGFRCAYRQP